MRVPAIQGLIRRRVLVNFRVDPGVMERQLPYPFVPKLAGGFAIAGICLIRLEQVRPRALPMAVGLSSENAAHRVAVTWTDDEGRAREGVYIARRDTSSFLNHVAGGRIFPGEHHAARFSVTDEEGRVAIALHSDDGPIDVRIEGRPAAKLPATSVFRSLEEASAFFEKGSAGYSVTREPERLDGLRLVTRSWRVEPLELTEAFSSYLADTSRFPAGSVVFDHALLMRDIEHEWEALPDLAVRERTAG
jgi:hypothetical protein